MMNKEAYRYLTEPNAVAKDMHHFAMDLCDMALNMCRGGHVADSIKTYEAALVLEEWVATNTLYQPARAILHRSAAEIALSAENPARAIELAVEGVKGDGVPSDIREEIEDAHYRATLHMKHAIPSAEDSP
jgi:hypothetical protein